MYYKIDANDLDEVIAALPVGDLKDKLTAMKADNDSKLFEYLTIDGLEDVLDGKNVTVEEVIEQYNSADGIIDYERLHQMVDDIKILKPR